VKRCLGSLIWGLGHEIEQWSSEDGCAKLFNGLAIVHVSTELGSNDSWMEGADLDVLAIFFLQIVSKLSGKINVRKFTLHVSVPWNIFLFAH